MAYVQCTQCISQNTMWTIEPLNINSKYRPLATNLGRKAIESQKGYIDEKRATVRKRAETSETVQKLVTSGFTRVFAPADLRTAG